MKIIECWIEHPVRSLDQTFTYISQEDCEPGSRVRIGFGKKILTGFVESVTDTDETKEQISQRLGFEVKEVLEVMDTSSLITDELHDLALWMRDQTLSTTISCFQAMLPAKIKPASTGHSIVKEKWVVLSDEEVQLTPKQLQAYLYVQEHQPLKYSELRKEFPNQARQLVDRGAVMITEQEKEAAVIESGSKDDAKDLTDLQKAAMAEITQTDDSVYLLHGVTGSGKTEVYLQLAAQALQQGRQVLILVPEISLTPQMISRVSSRFGERLAIYHSGLNAQEKYEQYRTVMTGKASIVVGTRSSVFLPFSDLGLIVMDEEHDPSYKQENQPAYHCRDIAIWRGKYHHCKVILGSATPSLDSYARAIRSVYHLVTLKERINQSVPQVTVVPMKDCIRSGQSYILSDLLKEKMADRLQKGQQSILLLNRRGYNTMMRCRSCQEVIKCPHCDLAMSWHRDQKKLKCHTCGTEIRMPQFCPVCGKPAGFSSYGYGTEKLQQEVQETFPEARILRMDADTTSRKNSHQQILEQFGNGEADILLGTQMIAKGLDYPAVTLVGVINGDEGLSRTDYRSCESTFDLLMQAGGRSGRAEDAGEVVYQVFDPDHYAVRSAARQDYNTFFTHEMNFRHHGAYPPYTYLISITITGRDPKQVDRTSLDIRQSVTGNFKTIGIISLLKVHDLIRNRIILKGKDLDEMRNALRKYMNETKTDLKGVRIDVNPMVLD